VVALHETASGITFAVKVQPRAKKNSIAGQLGDAVKVTLTAPPVDGRANQACIELFADLLNVSRSAITIIFGESSRNKVIRVSGVSVEALRQKLQG
jgi:hypothetical protein